MDFDDWSSFRNEVFGDGYLVWHEGPVFDELVARYRAHPSAVGRLVLAGIEADDPLAARALRMLPLPDDVAVRMAEVATSAASDVDRPDAFRVEASASAFALSGHHASVRPMLDVLRHADHWGDRIDAARRLGGLPVTAQLADAVAAAVSDQEFLVRCHAAATLRRWAGISDPDVQRAPALFARLGSDDPRDWEAASRRLRSRVSIGES